jgi:hypothetical protein
MKDVRIVDYIITFQNKDSLKEIMDNWEYYLFQRNRVVTESWENIETEVKEHILKPTGHPVGFRLTIELEAEFIEVDPLIIGEKELRTFTFKYENALATLLGVKRIELTSKPG